MTGITRERLDKIRLLALDIDGTLTDSHRNISPATLDALRRAAARGYLLALATGRVLFELPPELLALGCIPYAVLSNGASVMKLPGERLAFFPMEARRVEAVAALAQELGCLPEAYYNGRIYADARFLEKLSGYGFSPELNGYIRSTRENAGDIFAFLAVRKGELEGMDMVFGEGEEQALRRALQGIEGVCASSSAAHIMDIGDRETGKERGLTALLGRLGLSPENVMAFGDGENDGALLGMAGIGIAMGNAHPGTLRRADHVTASSDEEGVSRALGELGIV